MDKLITVSENLLKDILPHLKNTPSTLNPPNTPNFPNLLFELARLGLA